jgi:hypothetical protein
MLATAESIGKQPAIDVEPRREETHTVASDGKSHRFGMPSPYRLAADLAARLGELGLTSAGFVPALA